MSRNIPEVSVINKILVNAKIKQLDEKCLKVFGFMVNPKINYNLAGKVAGYAKIQTNEISLNAYLLEENKDAFINDTVAHEYIHLIQFTIYKSTRYNKIMPHGNEFYIVANKMGVNVTRCHSFKTVSARKTTKYIYSLKCGCNIPMTKKSHERINSVVGVKISTGEDYAVYACSSHKTKIYAKDFTKIVTE